MKRNIFAATAIGATLVTLLAQEQPIPNNKAVPVKPVEEKPYEFQQMEMSPAVLAAVYQDCTGNRVLISKAAMGKKVSLLSTGKMNKEEAARFIEKACLLEGLVFVPSGPNFVKLVLSQNAKNQGLPFVTEEALLPQGDAVVSYLMTFEHISPDDALRAFQSIVGTVKSHGSSQLLRMPMLW